MDQRLLTLFVLLLIGPAGTAPARDLAPMPTPDLSRVEGAVRQQLEAATSAVEQLADSASSPDRRAAVWGKLGRLYHTYDFSAAAETCYSNAWQLMPGDFRWAYYLGFLHQTGGRLDQAADALQQALSLRPDDLPTILRLAEVELDRGQLVGAQQLFEAALTADPAIATAHHGLGKIAARQNDPATAVRYFERALELDPRATLVHYPLALAHRELGDRAKAEHHLRQRGNAGPSFPDPLVRALDETASGVGLRLTRASVALAEGREKEAFDELRKAVAADPSSPEARLYLGIAMARRGETEGAHTELEQAVKLDPKNAIGHDALGTLLAHTGSDEVAVEHLRRAVEIEPRFEQAHFRLGAALARLERHRDAETSFSRVLELDPRHTEALLARATTRLDLDEYESARRDIEALLSHDPQNALARLRRGETLQRLGDDGALAEYLQALDIGLQPDEAAAAHLSAGNLLAGRRDAEAAAKHYRAAVTLDPDLIEARYNLAGILSGQGRHREAADSYRKVVDVQPENAAARFYLSEALLALGQHRDARQQLEEGLEASPRDGRLARTLARLLAACPDRSLRDGKRAIELALAVLQAQQSQGRPRLEDAETVAMAFAEIGRYDEAVKWQNEVINGAEGVDRPEYRAALRRNLARYTRGEACCAVE